MTLANLCLLREKLIDQALKEKTYALDFQEMTAETEPAFLAFSEGFKQLFKHVFVQELEIFNVRTHIIGGNLAAYKRLTEKNNLLRKLKVFLDMKKLVDPEIQKSSEEMHREMNECMRKCYYFITWSFEITIGKENLLVCLDLNLADMTLEVTQFGSVLNLKKKYSLYANLRSSLTETLMNLGIRESLAYFKEQLKSL